MPILYTIYIALTIASFGISGYVIWQLWKIRKSPGAISLVWTVHCALAWSIAYLGEVFLTNLSAKYIALKAEYLGIPFISLAIFVFSIVFTGRSAWLTRRNFVLLTIIPAATFLLAITNQWHSLVWSSVEMPASGAIGSLVLGHGLWYNVNVAYSYGLLFIATVFFVRVAFRGHRIYRTQATVMLVGMLLPWIANILYVFDILPVSDQDWTPLAFTLASTALFIGLTRFKLVDILPIAYSSVFNAMSSGIVVTDLQGRIIEVNFSAERIFEQHHRDLVGKGIRDILPTWDEWSSEAGAAFQVDHEISTGTGVAERIYSVRINPVFEQGGQLKAQIVIVSDITDQKQAQAQARLLVAALEAAQNGVIITNREGTIQWANPAFTALTGYGIEEVFGKNPRFLNSGEKGSEFYAQMWSNILSGQVWHGELVNRRKDGTLYNEEMTITPVVGKDKNISHFIAVKQDITQRKEVEAAMERARDEAVEANRLKTQLLANVSHDLRTPLGAIIGYSEMLQAGILGSMDDEQKKAVNEILDSANQLLLFINNIIGQAQIETGKIILHHRQFEPADLIDPLRSTISYHAARKKLNLAYVIDPSLPLPMIGDEYWLRQMLFNLVNNAIKFTDQGTVTIRFILKDTEHWAMEVEDTGVGIPVEFQEKIFAPFEQVDGSPTRRVAGSGLGLSIVKQLTEVMHGKIELKSAPGEGTKFTITLPLLGVQEIKA